MPLARIITDSLELSRELALDLLARGYSVEVVSPDKVPDNMADLELRVDAGPGNQLIASVEAHNGGRSTSLEFLHHLKAPMGDFVRRPPEPLHDVRFAGPPISFNAEPAIEDIEVPAALPPAEAADLPPVGEALFTPPDSHFDSHEQPAQSYASESDFEESARLIRTPEQEAPSSLESSTPTASEVQLENSILEHAESPHLQIVESEAEPEVVPVKSASSQAVAQPLRSVPAWLRPVGIVAAVVVLLALLFGFGMRRFGKAAAETPVAPSAKNVSVPKNASNPDTQAPPTLTAPVSAQTPAASAPGQEKSPASKSKTAAAHASAKSSRNSHGVISHDTVTYLDKSAEKNAKNAKSAQTAKHPASHTTVFKHSNDGIAPDTVTYLDGKPAPKTAKPN